MSSFKTMRRRRVQAEKLAASLRVAGYDNVKVERVSSTDWSITWSHPERKHGS